MLRKQCPGLRGAKSTPHRAEENPRVLLEGSGRYSGVEAWRGFVGLGGCSVERGQYWVQSSDQKAGAWGLRCGGSPGWPLMSPKTHLRVLRGSFRAGSGVSNPVALTSVLEAGQSGTFLGNSEQRVETEAVVQFPSQAVPPKPEQPRAAPKSRCRPEGGC